MCLGYLANTKTESISTRGMLAYTERLSLVVVALLSSSSVRTSGKDRDKGWSRILSKFVL